ncbi:MAG TPA: hypothetical protein VKN99_23055 [Polyangia bacterium]|nr:hypothetical protein [Polyangia bacterium]
MWALALALLGLAAGSGCGGAGSSPEAAVRALARATRAGDARAVYERLAPRTQARLAEAARTATEQAAGRRTFRPEDMLSVGAAPPKWEPVRVRELERTGERALVEVIGPEGQIQAVRTVRERGHWYVELP